MTANQSAFLAAIRHAEGTDQALDAYRVCFGYRHTLESFADHPTVTGEWRGESIANLGPAYNGLVSSAAGAYQIIKPTWLALKAKLKLPDFSPASQDAAALELIAEVGASGAVARGDFQAAVYACNGIWASLPGSLAGQPQRSLSVLLGSYLAAGGSVA